MKRRSAGMTERDDLPAPAARATTRATPPAATRAAIRVVEPADTLGAPDPSGRLDARAPESFDAFYRREFVSLLVLARALVGSAQAEDVAQEAMLVAFRRWRAIAEVRSPAAYVRGICLHKAVTVVRRRALERQLWGRFGAPATVGGADLSQESGALWEAVRRLPRRQAQAMALHYALDLPVADVAEVLGCAEGTVKVHLHRARAALADTLRAAEEGRS
jgi:RNA polymerase sigma-70 factor (ECF subfamily)